jgi:hypothetical protein
VESTAAVTAAEPLKEVPDNPEPKVKALVVEAVTVADPPKAIAEPFTVTDEFVRPAFGIVATEPITPPEVVVT